MEAFIVRAIALILTSLGTTQGRTPLERKKSPFLNWTLDSTIAGILNLS
jgi:hypothetical protein